MKVGKPNGFWKPYEQLTLQVCKAWPVSRKFKAMHEETQEAFQISFGLLRSKLPSIGPGFAELEPFVLF